MCRLGAVFCARMVSAQHFLLACAAVRQVPPPARPAGAFPDCPRGNSHGMRPSAPSRCIPPTVLAGAVMGCVPKQPWSAALERDSGAARKPKRLSVPFTVPVGTAGTFHGWTRRMPDPLRSQVKRRTNSALSGVPCSRAPPAPQLSVSMYSRPPAAFCVPLSSNSAKRPRARLFRARRRFLCRTCGAHRSSR